MLAELGWISALLRWTWIATLFAEGLFLLIAPSFSRELLTEMYLVRTHAWQFIAAAIVLIGLGPDWFRQGIRLVAIASLMVALLVFIATFQALLDANRALAGLVLVPPFYTSIMVYTAVFATRNFLNMRR